MNLQCFLLTSGPKPHPTLKIWNSLMLLTSKHISVLMNLEINLVATSS